MDIALHIALKYGSEQDVSLSLSFFFNKAAPKFLLSNWPATVGFELTDLYLMPKNA